MTKKSRSRRVKDTTRNQIAVAVPSANRILQELALAYPEYEPSAIPTMLKDLDPAERNRLVNEMIMRISKDTNKPRYNVTFVNTDYRYGFRWNG